MRQVKLTRRREMKEEEPKPTMSSLFNPPSKMATKPMSEVPSAKKEFISKLSSASEKAKSYGRKVSSVSKEFDGKEVQGKRIESRGGKNIKEIYSMPGGGKRVEKERYNQAGNIVSRKIKDTKIN
jgi:hypothetical protein